jgi:hypothetical protein
VLGDVVIAVLTEVAMRRDAEPGELDLGMA